MRKTKGMPVYTTMADITKIKLGVNGKMIVPDILKQEPTLEDLRKKSKRNKNSKR